MLHALQQLDNVTLELVQISRGNHVALDFLHVLTVSCKNQIKVNILFLHHIRLS